MQAKKFKNNHSNLKHYVIMYHKKEFQSGHVLDGELLLETETLSLIAPGASRGTNSFHNCFSSIDIRKNP